MYGKLLSLLALLSVSVALFWGFKPEADYIFPMKGQNALSGTFGELRPNHFHSGIDIKTGGRIGVPLYAIQDGYVYRIKISPYGFGKAVYLRHPDGRFSVYGHMSRFTPEIEEYAYQRQLSARQYAQEIYLGRTEIPVKQGQLIGYSGNSGSSLGPHLHFEIRDPQERIMDPLIWYKPNLPDTRKPTLQLVGFEPLEANSRVRGEFRKLTLTPGGSNGNYQLSNTVKIQGKVGLEYKAFDLLNGAGNHCGINHVQLFLDGELLYDYDLQTFDFDEKRYINLHMDYPRYFKQRERLQRAYIEAGNRFNAYNNGLGKGWIELKDDAVHRFRLVLKDKHGNRSQLTGNIQRDTKASHFPTKPVFYQTPRATYEVKRNLLVIKASRAHRSYLEEGLTYQNIYGQEKMLRPAYMKGQQMVFILPLNRFDYPRRVFDQTGQIDWTFDFQSEIHAGKNNLVELDQLQLFFPYEAIFGSHHLQVRKKPAQAGMLSEIYQVGRPSVPLFKSYLVSFKPREDIPLTHLVVARKSRGKWKYVGSQVGEDGNVYASTREFGEYCLMEDKKAPEVRPQSFVNGGRVSRSQRYLTLRVEDSFSDINHMEIYCTLDGAWKLFEYNYKTKTIRHDLSRGRPAPGTYTLEINVRDGADNLATKTYTLSFQ
ncbi:MAG: M23 family metallopeptidase [Bacteroidota bacterium]